ncbi:fibroblast growth factor receptor-like 1 [Nematostella vectensis]|uniref:fibroblast growth factor receptor-like 1 n=1 Tax=Nematostella vectensis TaxID=45351 RepID=UPI00138FBBA7|nr:fibroblast growth factor receptor-like 1 [Nematostella vectensis]
MHATDVSLVLLLLRGIAALATSSRGPPYFAQQQKMKGTFIAWPAWHTIKLKCKAEGTPPLTFTWLKNGKPITHRRLQPGLKTNQWYLRLRDLVPADTGDYTCVVSNPYGQINHTYTLQVVMKLRTKPILKCDYPKNTTSDIGKNATLACIVAVSGTLPDFRWIRWNSVPNGPIDLERGKFTVIDPIHYKTIPVGGDSQESGVELRLENLTEREFGLYTCVVSNHLGRDYRSAFLWRRKPKRPSQAITRNSVDKSETPTANLQTSRTSTPLVITNEMSDAATSTAAEPRIPLSVFIGVLSAWATLTVAALIWCHLRVKKSTSDKHESWL